MRSYVHLSLQNIHCTFIFLIRVIVHANKSEHDFHYFETALPLSLSSPQAQVQQQQSTKPYALSSVYLLKLAENEEMLYSNLKAYAEILKTRLNLAETYLNEYEQGRRGNNDLHFLTASDVVANPLASIKMIRRLSLSLNSLVMDMNEDPEGMLLQEMGEMDGQAAYPSENEYREALQSLMQLQYFYDLKPHDIMQGVIQSKHTGIELTELECREITEFSVSNDYYYMALEWIKLLEKFPMNDTDLHQLGFRSAAELLQTLVTKHDTNFELNLKQGQPYIYASQIGSNIDTLPLKLKTELSKLSKETGKVRNSVGGSFTYSHIALCNGEDLMSVQKKSKLYCWLDSNRNPYFRISPLKIEMLHDEPLLLQIYDIVSDVWIKEIKNAATPHLTRAPKPATIADTLRTAIYAWLSDEEIPNTPIARLHELIFDLNVRGENASELLQVASYALGGLVSLHVDYLGGIPNETVESDNAEEENNPDVLLKGDRVSTFLVYLNDVEMGGYTAFTKLKTFVKPVKGSVVFWYTSLRNGKVDGMMLHGACPILYGHKWIATKWVHQFQNFLKRPCSKDQYL